MSTTSASGLRIVTFGELRSGAWGAAWGAAEPSVAVGIVGREAARADVAGSGPKGRLEGAAPGEVWGLGGEGIELELSPSGEPARNADGFDQLCRVRGSIAPGGDSHAVDSLGRRGVHAAPELRGVESIRDVSGWFEPGEGVALTALRPRPARGHDRELVRAWLLAPAGAVAVAEPRLSTTYAGGGLPARVSLELWLGEDEEGEQVARRFAGEALGAGAKLAHEDLDVHVQLLRCHGAGREGAGVYMLARPSRARGETPEDAPVR